MAQKRMFDKRVIETDKFIDLPISAKALYFIAGMDADDKGFFQPKKLQRTYGFSEDDFKVLIAKQYFIIFETGVMVITDWNKNNWLDTRRIQETEYINELKLLQLINEKYELSTSAKQMLSENSIEENRIEENSISTHNFIKPTIEEIKNFCEERKNNINANKFYDFYESKGWMIGKNKMRDWKACIRTWENKIEQDVKPSWYGKQNKKEEMTEEELKELENQMKGFE